MTEQFTLKEIGQTIPSGGKIVAMVEHKGQVVIATEKHIFRGSFGDDRFTQCVFYTVDGITDEPDRPSATDVNDGGKGAFMTIPSKQIESISAATRAKVAGAILGTPMVQGNHIKFNSSDNQADAAIAALLASGEVVLRKDAEELVKHATHRSNCDWTRSFPRMQCNCGYDEALARFQSQGAE